MQSKPPHTHTEPEKQFKLVEDHIDRIRNEPVFMNSEIVIMCERNLGFEAEHHEKALRNLRLVRHRVDREAKRFGEFIVVLVCFSV
jgi:hypothetical protein